MSESTNEARDFNLSRAEAYAEAAATLDCAGIKGEAANLYFKAGQILSAMGEPSRAARFYSWSAAARRADTEAASDTPF